MIIFDTISNVFSLIPLIKIEVMIILFVVVYMVDLLSYRYISTPCQEHQFVDFHMCVMNIYSMVPVMIDAVF